jgi:hypothetical protein
VGVLLLGLGRAQAQLPTDAAAAVALSAEQERAAAGQAHSVAHAALGAVMGATQNAAPAAQDAPAAQAAPAPPAAPAVPAAAAAPTDGAQVALGAPPDGVPSPGEIPPAYVGAAPEPVRHGRDPFRPFTLDLHGEINENEILTPLQRYELPQLRLAGVVLDLRPPRAMLQDNSGMGYIVTPGTPIGRRHGVVKAIEPHRIVVEEQVLDYYGNKEVHQVLIEMPKDNKPQQGAGQE